MSTRYVWEKYNTAYTMVKTKTIGKFDNFGPDSPSCSFYVTMYTGKGEPPIVDGVFDFSENVKHDSLHCYSDENYDSVSVTGYYFAVHAREDTTAPITTIYKYPTGGYVRAEDGERYVTATDELYAYGIKSGKGTAVQGSISADAMTYPTNGIRGADWYVYQGSDAIDPLTVSILDTPRAGKPVGVAVAPVTNTYGGVISYAYEYSVDGGASWQAAQTATATEIALAVPEGAETLQVRVKASDNMGFTSADYIYSEAVAVKAAGGITVTIDGVAREQAMYACIDGVLRPIGTAAVIDGIQRDIF